MPFDPGTILVTGGCGFIGSNFIRYMLDTYEDINILNLDLLTYAGNMENLLGIDKDPRYRFFKGDIRDKEDVAKLMSEADSVIHFAAESHVDRSISGALEFIDTNVKGTYILLDAALRRMEEDGLRRFVMISTDEVYGDVTPGKSSSENDALMPRNPYAASKAGADRLAYSYYATYGLPVIITRSSNNYGPYQHPEKFLPLSITNLLEGKDIPLYGDGRNVRDWLHVHDNCRGIDLALRNGDNGEVYNIGGNSERENRMMVDSLLKELGLGIDRVRYVTDRKGHDRRYSMDISKAREDLGWEPRIRLEEGLSETVDWYRENTDWWRPLKARN